MTKIEKYQEVKDRNARMIRALENQVERPKVHDKTGLCWKSGVPASHEHFQPFTLYTALHSGDYGNSGTQSDYVEGIDGVLSCALNELKPQIILHAVRLLNDEIVKAAEAARGEANEVLDALANESEES